jgi:hypothetical protein
MPLRQHRALGEKGDVNLPVRRQAADEPIGMGGSEHGIPGILENHLRFLSLLDGLVHLGFSRCCVSSLKGQCASLFCRRAI